MPLGSDPTARHSPQALPGRPRLSPLRCSSFRTRVLLLALGSLLLAGVTVPLLFFVRGHTAYSSHRPPPSALPQTQTTLQQPATNTAWPSASGSQGGPLVEALGRPQHVRKHAPPVSLAMHLRMERDRRQRLLLQYSSQPVGGPWAATMASTIRSEFFGYRQTHAGVLLHSVECRARGCRVDLHFDGATTEKRAQLDLRQRRVFSAEGCSMHSLGSKELAQTLVLNCRPVTTQ